MIANNDDVPEGADFVRAILQMASRCETESDQYIETFTQEFGTVLSLLDRASSCYWGCAGGDHTAEHIVGRSCGLAMGAFSLARSGSYDESLSLTRSLGETANLAYLFATDMNILGEWKNANDHDRKRNFTPLKIRMELEKKGKLVPIDENRYRQLSEKGTHIVPRIPPQMYNSSKLSVASGVFQKVGLCVCLTELGYALSILGHCVSKLCNLRDEHAVKINDAIEALGRSLPELRHCVNASMPGTYT